MSVVMNMDNFLKGLDAHVERFEIMMSRRLLAAQEWAMVSLLDMTPVWSGQAAASYSASIGAPKPYVHPGFTPQDGTNRMPLGPEANRKEAESISWFTLPERAPKDPWQIFWIVNAAPHISGLEHGELPNGPGLAPRAEKMFHLTAAKLTAAFNARRL